MEQEVRVDLENMSVYLSIYLSILSGCVLSDLAPTYLYVEGLGGGRKIGRDGEKGRRGERGGTLDVYIGQSDFPPRDVTGQNTLPLHLHPTPPHPSFRETEGRERGGEGRLVFTLPVPCLLGQFTNCLSC